MAIVWQPSLLDEGVRAEPTFDATYDALGRVTLDDRSWVDYCPGWLSGADTLLAELLDSTEWQQRRVHMYDREVLEPRLTAGWSTDNPEEPVPEVIRDMAASLSERYDVVFDQVWANLYRDGADSVAWHGDRNRHVMTEPLVATVSLGARRKFQLRRRGTSRIAHTFTPGAGDLLVMGGRCQHDWEHTVPKTKQAVGARISVTIRHSQPSCQNLSGL